MLPLIVRHFFPLRRSTLTLLYISAESLVDSSNLSGSEALSTLEFAEIRSLPYEYNYIDIDDGFDLHCYKRLNQQEKRKPVWMRHTLYARTF